MAKTPLTQFRGAALSDANAGTAVTGALTAARGSAAAGRPNTFQNSGRTHLRITNDDVAAAANPAYVTVRSRVASNQGRYNHPVVRVAKGETRLAGPFPVGRFGSEVELYYTSTEPLDIGAGAGPNGFQGAEAITDLGTELTAAQAGELRVEALG